MGARKIFVQGAMIFGPPMQRPPTDASQAQDAPNMQEEEDAGAIGSEEQDKHPSYETEAVVHMERESEDEQTDDELIIIDQNSDDELLPLIQ